MRCGRRGLIPTTCHRVAEEIVQLWSGLLTATLTGRKDLLVSWVGLTCRELFRGGLEFRGRSHRNILLLTLEKAKSHTLGTQEQK